MTFNQLEEKLEADLGWRKKEISELMLIAKVDPNKEVILKSLILLLYAHWEGYIKLSSKVYLKYVSESKKRLNELTENFKAIALKDQIKQCLDSGESMTLQNEVRVLQKLANAEKIKFKIPTVHKTNSDEVIFDENNEFDNNIINTYSNLNPKIFKNILSVIGFDYKDVLVAKERYIDSHLLANRNLIGHGSKFKKIAEGDFNLEIKDIEKLRDIIFSIIDNFKEEILEYSKQEFFLKRNSEGLNIFLNEKSDELEKTFKRIEEKYN